jgi:hypothetical protein
MLGALNDTALLIKNKIVISIVFFGGHKDYEIKSSYSSPIFFMFFGDPGL